MRRSLDKKGVSPVIGYILLISFVIIISLIVYQWVKTYVPREALECPDGVSIFIKEKEVDCSANPVFLNLTLKNNGRFNISGYFIRSSNTPDSLAVDSLWDSIFLREGATEGRVSFDNIIENKDNSFGPGEEEQDNFTFIPPLTNKISFIEIIPVRYEEIDNRLRLSSCSDAKIIEVICGGDLDCTPDCNYAGSCGLDDGCRGSCSGSEGNCATGGICNVDGDCVTCGNSNLDTGEMCDYNGGLFCNDDTQPSPCTCETGYIPEGDPSINCVSAPDLTLEIIGVPVVSNKEVTFTINKINLGTDDATDYYFNIVPGGEVTAGTILEYGGYNLLEGISEEETFSITYKNFDTYNLIIMIDNRLTIDEFNEDDNTATIEIVL